MPEKGVHHKCPEQWAGTVVPVLLVPLLTPQSSLPDAVRCLAQASCVNHFAGLLHLHHMNGMHSVGQVGNNASEEAPPRS